MPRRSPLKIRSTWRALYSARSSSRTSRSALSGPSLRSSAYVFGSFSAYGPASQDILSMKCEILPRAQAGRAVKSTSAATTGLKTDIVTHKVFCCWRGQAARHTPAGSTLLCEVGLDLPAAALVDDLASHGIARVSKAVACRRKRTAHAMHALADHHLDRLRALAEDRDVDFLPRAGQAYLYFFGGKRGLSVISVQAARRARNIEATASGAFGGAKSSPWQTRQPASARNSRCACVSTPFATTPKFMPRASAIRARASPARSVSCGMPAISLRSMHTALARRRCSVGSAA